MNERSRALTIAAAATTLFISLFFAPPPAVHAWQGDLQADPLHEARQREQAAAQARKRTMSAIENPRICGKCHSACEPGRSHGGRAAESRHGDIEFPLTADARVTCLTCHRPHRDGSEAAGLRISNLKRELCLACHPSAAGEAPRIEIISPPERALVREERVALIGRASGRIEGHLTVRLNGAAFQVQADGRDFVTWLTLREGANRCELSQGGKVLWRGEIFRGEGDARGYARSALGHRTGSQQECRDCHGGAPGEVGAAPDRGSDLCYGCHERVDGKRYLHGPLAVGACLACHDPHGGYGTAHLREEQTLLCGKCHGDRGSIVASGCDPRGKACAACHDPHQSDERYLLKGPKYTYLRGAGEGR